MTKHELFIVAVIMIGLDVGAVLATEPEHLIGFDDQKSVKIKRVDDERPLPRPCQSVPCSPTPSQSPPGQ